MLHSFVAPYLLLLYSIPSDAAPIVIKNTIVSSQQMIHAFERTTGRFLVKRDAATSQTEPVDFWKWKYALYGVIVYVILMCLFYIASHFLVQRIKYQLAEELKTVATEETRTSSSIEQMKVEEEPAEFDKKEEMSAIQVTLTSTRPEGTSSDTQPLSSSIMSRVVRENEELKKVESTESGHTWRQRAGMQKYFEEEDKTQELLTGSIRDVEVERVETAGTLSTPGDIAPWPASNTESSSSQTTTSGSTTTTSSSTTSSSASYSSRTSATDLSSFSSPSESDSSSSSTLTPGSRSSSSSSSFSSSTSSRSSRTSSSTESL